jgi:aldose sugar dehydrogenase
MATTMHFTTRFGLLVLGAFAIACGSAPAQELDVRVVSPGPLKPWEILWGRDGMIWMSEHHGRISRVDPESGEVRPMLTVPDVYETGESGMLGMAVTEQYLFVVYNYIDGTSIRERMVRYTIVDTTLVEPRILVNDIPAATIHSGSRLVITPDSKVLMTVGDGSNHNLAQQHTAINGKLLRMNFDGSAPADNPFAAAPYPTNLIWTTGHRNAQGLVLAPNGILYSSEHGPSNDDEINIIERGRNYGWPLVMGFCNTPDEQRICNDSNVVEPLIAWTPTIATCGLDYYDNPRIPAWRHTLILTTLKEADVRILALSEDGRRITRETVHDDARFGRVRDVCIAPDGRVFIAAGSRLLEIAPTPASADASPVSGDLRVVAEAGRLAITIDRPVRGPLQFAIVDITGATLKSWWTEGSNGPIDELVSTVGMAAGKYFVRVAGGEEVWTEGFVVR